MLVAGVIEALDSHGQDRSTGPLSATIPMQPFIPALLGYMILVTPRRAGFSGRDNKNTAHGRCFLARTDPEKQREDIDQKCIV